MVAALGELDRTFELSDSVRLNVRLLPDMGNRVVAAANFVRLHLYDLIAVMDCKSCVTPVLSAEVAGLIFNGEVLMCPYSQAIAADVKSPRSKHNCIIACPSLVVIIQLCFERGDFTSAAIACEYGHMSTSPLKIRPATSADSTGVTQLLQSITAIRS